MAWTSGALRYARAHRSPLLNFTITSNLPCGEPEQRLLLPPAQSTRDPALVAMALRDIMHMRHEIVHRGAFGAPIDGDVSFLQDCCTEALSWLAKHHEALPEVEHLRIYFQHVSATDAQVGRVLHVLSRLPEIRQPRGQADGGASRVP